MPDFPILTPQGDPHNERGDYRDPCAPISLATLRTLKMSPHLRQLEINAPGICVACSQKSGQFRQMQPDGPEHVKCPGCGERRLT